MIARVSNTLLTSTSGTASSSVSASSSADQYGYGGDLNCGQGYFFVASDGGIFDYGSAGFFGSSAFLVSAGLASSFLGVAAGPLALRISWMYCSRIRAR